jgi:starch synthase (maltosyl-transferring)
MAKKKARHDAPRLKLASEASPEPETSSRPLPVLPTGQPLRPAIEQVRPVVDDGRFPAKAAVGDVVLVEADIFADGHDLLFCELHSAAPGGNEWTAVPMEALANDRWRGGFEVTDLGLHRFVISAEIDPFSTWSRDVEKKLGAGQDVTIDLAAGAQLLTEASKRARGKDRQRLGQLALQLPELSASEPVLRTLLGSEDVANLVSRNRDPGGAVRSPTFPVQVEPERARFGSWYELFPRSASPDPTRPGTLSDVIERLPALERMGIDILYLPPIHPIGHTHRKGRDGAAVARPDDPGSPWAIGSAAGGHMSVDPSLGTLADVDRLVAAAAARSIQVALDLAFQCSPDHPWVTEHPQWFRHRPDGTIQFAENPPKRYEDIYPLDFECEEWRELWSALLEVVLFWIDRGVTIFRVDNPHTKPFAFWEWLITSVRERHAEVIFLSEAFTRPRVMERLAKLGFSQSYTYFTWRNTKWELETYLHELTRTQVADYLRPNFWPTTPDILTEALQFGTTATFVTRLVLAATLAANYGIYGPSFELQEHRPRSAGSEEFAGSEKYEVRYWDLDGRPSLGDLVGRVNKIRRQNPALQRNDTLRFHSVDNEQLLVYSKSYQVEARRWTVGERTGPTEQPNVVLVAVNLHPTAVQSGWVHLDLEALGVEPDRPFAVHDLLTNAHYEWSGPTNFIELDPGAVPAHIFVVRRPEVRPLRGAAK